MSFARSRFSPCGSLGLRGAPASAPGGTAALTFASLGLDHCSMKAGSASMQ